MTYCTCPEDKQIFNSLGGLPQCCKCEQCDIDIVIRDKVTSICKNCKLIKCHD